MKKIRLLNYLLIVLVIGIFSSVIIGQGKELAEKQAQEIIAKYKEAIGGEENLEKIKTVEKY